MTGDQAVVLLRDVPAEGGLVRIISLNRPHRRNAMNTEMIELLRTSLLAADEDARVVGIVITGEGGAFSGGGDVREFSAAGDSARQMHRAQLMADLFLLPRRLGTPVIAAARGATVGGGAALALAADMVVAGDDIVVGYPELVRSIPPTAVMVGLARQLGARLAFELLVTGRFLDAPEALELRLVNRVVAADETLDEAIALARAMSDIDVATMRTAKQLFYRGRDLPDEEAMAAGLEVLREVWQLPTSDD